MKDQINGTPLSLNNNPFKQDYAKFINFIAFMAVAKKCLNLKYIIMTNIVMSDNHQPNNYYTL